MGRAGLYVGEPNLNAWFARRWAVGVRDSDWWEFVGRSGRRAMPVRRLPEAWNLRKNAMLLRNPSGPSLFLIAVIRGVDERV